MSYAYSFTSYSKQQMLNLLSSYVKRRKRKTFGNELFIIY